MLSARRTRIVTLAIAAALLVYAYVVPGIRRRFIQDVTSWDAEPTAPVALSRGVGPGLAPIARTRVILIDGLSASTARTLPVWKSLCDRGLALRVDVGFPTVSLPVQISLWTGLTQQQTGVVFRSDRPLVPPLANSIPAMVPGSRAVAEYYGYIIGSIGFASALPLTSPVRPAKDLAPTQWKSQWEAAALETVTSDARLAFVHVLRVDTWGHRKGRDSAEYQKAADESDAILGRLVEAAPDARWFLLSDHGHLPRGGHGGEDREVRQVEHCIVDPVPGATPPTSPTAPATAASTTGTATAGNAAPTTARTDVPGYASLAPARGGLVHLVDISRAIADSVGVSVDPRSVARPLAAARFAALDDDQAVPALELGTGALAIFVLALGVAASGWSVRRWWLAPWWFVVGIVVLLVVRGEPTMSTPMTYAREDLFDAFDFNKRLMMRSWAVALPLLGVATWFGLGRTTAVRVVIAQLALPLAMLAAALTACGAWPSLFGAEVAPVAPRYTAYASPLFVITAQGAAVVSLVLLARLAREAFGRRERPETARSAPSDA